MGSLAWYRDGTPFFIINIVGGTTGTPPDGLQVAVSSVQRTGATANFISTLTVDIATLVGDSDICCGLLTLFDDCINVTLIGKATYFRIEIVYLWMGHSCDASYTKYAPGIATI